MPAGELTCRASGERRGIERGIVDLMSGAPDYVLREQADLDRFAEVMRADSWDREPV